MTSFGYSPGTEPAADASGSEEGGQILTFSLGRTIFAIEVAQVREVLDHRPISALANAPANLLGIIDVRGESVPVVDLKRKLALANAEREVGPETRIVVLEIGGSEGRRHLAVVADVVHEVSDFDPASLERVPEFGERWDADFVRGLGRRNEEFLTLLDVEAVFRASTPSLETMPAA